MTDTLLAAFKKIMSMSDGRTSLIQMSFYGSYFLLALPAALFIYRFTYKAGVLLGLGLFVAGALLFYPASQTMVYGHFLTALFILAGGLSILETTSNPYIIAMGPVETGTQRLNLAQSFNPIGSITGVLLSKFYILSKLNQAGADERSIMTVEQLKDMQAAELSAVMGPYVGVAGVLIVVWILIATVRMPAASERGKVGEFLPTFGRLFKRRNYRMGVVAQFFYVGAQIGVWSFTIRYVMLEKSINEDQAATYYLAALILFVTARFIFTGLMRFISPRTLLAISSILAFVSTLIVVFAGGVAGVYALVAISFFMSLMFPTIYGMAVEGLGNDMKVGGSGLIMAILGGAVLTFIQGQVSDATGSIHLAYLVPAGCFIVVLAFSLMKKVSNVH
jgi:FHS family L-fucose permease-like MFS transporter